MCRAERGFTLLETVVAMAILGLTLALAYQSLGWALRRGAEQRQREQALLAAQSLLGKLRGERSMSIGRRRGRAPQGLAWEWTIEPYQAAVDPSGPHEPLAVTITVSWGERQGQRVALRSVELGVTP
jgi:general secretion pathway protein I